METNKNSKRNPSNFTKELVVVVVSGGFLMLFGAFMFWAISQDASFSHFWPGLVLGFCFSLFVPYLVFKTMRRKTRKSQAKQANTNKSAGQFGSIGAGLGVLIGAMFFRSRCNPAQHSRRGSLAPILHWLFLYYTFFRKA